LMNVRQWFAVDTWRLNSRIWGLIFATFTAVFAILVSTPLTLPGLALLLSALSYAGWRDGALPALRMITWRTSQGWTWLAAGGACAVYILLSTLWSADPTTTLMTGALVLCLIAGVHVAARLLDSCPAAWLEHMTRTMLVAFILALLHLLLEEATGHAVKKTLLWPFKATRLDSVGIGFDRKAEVEIFWSSIKWRMPPLAFMLWPMLLITALQLTGRRAAEEASDQRTDHGTGASQRAVQVIQAVILLLSGWLIWLSGHRSSQVAFAAAVVVFIATLRWPVAVRRLLGAAWAGAFLLIIPLSILVNSTNLHEKAVFKDRLDVRFVYWGTTVERMRNQPIFGIGAAATTRLNLEENLPELPAYQKRTGPHAHNIFLQSWYELGAVGTLLLLGLGLLVLRSIATAPAPTQPYLLTAFATVMVTSGASFGLFETWFMGTFALCAFTCLIAVAYDRRL
jgi:O-antigen ligase